jgi:flagellar basal-body rod protein FlgF
MENALLVGLSRQMVLRRELDVVANNVANVNTTGFRADRLLFREHMIPTARTDAYEHPDRRVRFVIDPATHVDHRAGRFDLSGNDFDLAIQGEGFFVVETPRGQRFTRNGAFQKNAQGEIVTAQGYRLMSDAGPIQLQAADTRFQVGQDGTVSTENGTRGRVRVVRFEDETQLRKDIDQTFSTTAQPQPVTGTRVVQGAIERSNVEPIVEMSRMIELTRAYQSITQIIERTQDLRRTAIERLAGLN